MCVSDKANARSIMLVFQSALPVLLFAKHQTKLILRGKTDEETVPPIDYTKFIFLPFLKKHFGIDCQLEVHKRGVSSLGRGEVSITVKPLSRKLEPRRHGDTENENKIHKLSNVEHWAEKGVMRVAVTAGVYLDKETKLKNLAFSRNSPCLRASVVQFFGLNSYQTARRIAAS